MATLNINYRFIFRIFMVILFVVFAWFFPSIILYIFLAFILALMGKPLANAICSVTVFKRHIPYSICSLLAILIFLVIMVLTITLFIPMMIKEVRTIENIDYEQLAYYLNNSLNRLQYFLYDNGLMELDQTIVGALIGEINNFVNVESFTNILGNVVSTTGSFLMGLFAVFFMAFFFIKDDIRIEKLAEVFISNKYTQRMKLISEKINSLLTRYCVGSFIRIMIMIVLLYIGFLLFGIKNSLFHAFFGGVLNIIPYLGPIIGVVISCIFGFINCISMDMYTEIVPVMIKITGIYVVANVIDNVLLQPLIFSQSVKIHPVEVFLVTILGGDMAGMTGMILAIPVYTIIRIILIEIYNFTNKSTLLIEKKVQQVE